MATSKRLHSMRIGYVCLLTLLPLCLVYIYTHYERTIQYKIATNINDMIVPDGSGIGETTELRNIMETEIHSSEQNENNIRWVILVTVNMGYMDFFLNWYISFKQFNLTCPVIVTTEDDGSYEILKRFQSYKLLIERDEDTSVENAADYRSKAFNLIVNRRPKLILKYISDGFNVLYVDMDTVWLKNPFPYLEWTFDVALPERGSEHTFNSGLIAARNSTMSKKLMRDWDVEILNNPTQPNQPALNRCVDMLKNDLNLLVLDASQFPTGCVLFGYKNPEKIIDIPEHVVIVHNSCLVGHKIKKHRFVINGLWYLQTEAENETLHPYIFEQILN